MIEYIDETHTYINEEGIIIPSVSTLCQLAEGNQYSNVPQRILDEASHYGTLLHSAVQDYIEKKETKKFNDYRKNIAMEQFTQIWKRFERRETITEEMVDFNGRYAGRVDIFQPKAGALFDIKTNSVYPKEHLEWQLGFYVLAIRSKFEYLVKEAWCIWLPKKGNAELIEVTPRRGEECLKILEEYEQAHKSTTDYTENQI